MSSPKPWHCCPVAHHFVTDQLREAGVGAWSGGGMALRVVVQRHVGAMRRARWQYRLLLR